MICNLCPRKCGAVRTADRGEGYFEQELRAVLGSYYRPLVFLKSLQGTDCLQARLPYELNLH